MEISQNAVLRGIAGPISCRFYCRVGRANPRRFTAEPGDGLTLGVPWRGRYQWTVAGSSHTWKCPDLKAQQPPWAPRRWQDRPPSCPEHKGSRRSWDGGASCVGRVPEAACVCRRPHQECGSEGHGPWQVETMGLSQQDCPMEGWVEHCLCQTLDTTSRPFPRHWGEEAEQCGWNDCPQPQVLPASVLQAPGQGAHGGKSSRAYQGSLKELGRKHGCGQLLDRSFQASIRWMLLPCTWASSPQGSSASRGCLQAPPDWTPGSQCHCIMTVGWHGGWGDESTWSRPTRAMPSTGWCWGFECPLHSPHRQRPPAYRLLLN